MLRRAKSHPVHRHSSRNSTRLQRNVWIGREFSRVLGATSANMLRRAKSHPVNPAHPLQSLAKSPPTNCAVQKRRDQPGAVGSFRTRLRRTTGVAHGVPPPPGPFTVSKWRRCVAGCHGFVLEPVCSLKAPAHGFEYEPVALISPILCCPFSNSEGPYHPRGADRLAREPLTRAESASHPHPSSNNRPWSFSGRDKDSTPRVHRETPGAHATGLALHGGRQAAVRAQPPSENRAGAPPARPRPGPASLARGHQAVFLFQGTALLGEARARLGPVHRSGWSKLSRRRPAWLPPASSGPRCSTHVKQRANSREIGRGTPRFAPRIAMPLRSTLAGAT